MFFECFRLFSPENIFKGGFFVTVIREDKEFFKKLIFLAIPIIIQELLNSAVNMVDVIMIGTLGIHEVAAVGLANQIFFLFILVCFGITSGASIFIGQFYGKGDYESIHKVMGISFVSSMLVATIFASGAIFFPEAIMSIYTRDERVIELAAKYLRPIGISYFFLAVIVTINSALRSIGQTKFPMFTSIIALTFNVTLTYVLIFIFDMGITGAAISTVITRAIELILQIILIRKFRLIILAPIKVYFSADRIFIKMFFATAGSVIINEFIWALGTSLYQVAYQFAGTEGQGAIQIASPVQNLFLVISIAIGTSCGIMIANQLGAGEREKAIRYSRKCITISVSFSIVMGILLIFASPLIISLFNVYGIVEENVRNILYVIAIGMTLKTFNYATIVGILRSGGDTKFCLYTDLGTVWLVGVPMAFFGAIVLGMPIHLILLMSYGEEVSKAIVSGLRVKSNKWANTLVN